MGWKRKKIEDKKDLTEEEEEDKDKYKKDLENEKDRTTIHFDGNAIYE